MFSELVDNVVTRSGRLDKQADIVSYANATLRECQALALFWRDLFEDTINPTAGVNSYNWDVPNNFRRLKALKYSSTGYEDVFPPKLPPGKIQRGQDTYYYFATKYIVFSGLGVFGGSTTPDINIAYYTRPIRFKYYEEVDRPAVYDTEADDWDAALYNPVLTGTAAAQLAQAEVQQNLVANWILLSYFEIVEEGTLAKVLKQVGDARAPSSFALYKSYQKDLISLEANEAVELMPEN